MKKNKKDLLGGESNPGQPGDSRLYLTTILPKISVFIHFSFISLFVRVFLESKTTKNSFIYSLHFQLALVLLFVTLSVCNCFGYCYASNNEQSTKAQIVILQIGL